MAKPIYEVEESPRFYWYAGRHRNDSGYILPRMGVIPPDKQKEVSENYESIFLDLKSEGKLREAREQANTYLNGRAKYYENLREKT